MKRLFFAAVLILSIAAVSYGIVAPDGPDSYSPGAEVIYAQAETREVYGSGAIQNWVPGKSTKWAVAYDDPITGEFCNGSLVMVYRLPERNDKLIEARSLMFNLNRIYLTRMERIDLYGIGSYAPAELEDPNFVVTSDMYYTGVWGGDPDATALDQMVFAADTLPGGTIDRWFANSADGALRLSCWLNSLYDNGAVAGDYVLLRLNYSLKYTVYTSVDIWNINSPDNVRIYYDLVDSLSETCPESVVPERVCVGSTAGDLTNDCIINLDDFVVMANDWLRCERIPDRLCE